LFFVTVDINLVYKTYHTHVYRSRIAKTVSKKYNAFLQQLTYPKPPYSLPS